MVEIEVSKNCKYKNLKKKFLNKNKRKEYFERTTQVIQPLSGVLISTLGETNESCSKKVLHPFLNRNIYEKSKNSNPVLQPFQNKYVYEKSNGSLNERLCAEVYTILRTCLFFQ